MVGILLAAGNSQRFDGNKLLHPLSSGELLGVAAARNLVAAIPDSLAIVRPGDRYLAEVFNNLGLRVVENLEADRGLGRSLAAGVSVNPDAAGWIVALADMPWIRPRTIVSLTNALRLGGSMVAPVYRGRRGHPVGFDRKWRKHLQALTGAQGARTLLAKHASELTLQQTADSGVVRDVDRLEDLRGM